MNIGPITFYPISSAMHGAINISTRRWGFVCFKIGWRWPSYFYLSPNGTPWGATLLLGGRFDSGEKKMARLRRVLWGHGYDPSQRDPHCLDDYIDGFAGHLPSQEQP